LLFLPLIPVDLLQSDALDDTHRGERGFGSSGTGER
jgi:dUTPase